MPSFFCPARTAVWDEFESLRGLPRCCGAIDGTFVRILAPWSWGKVEDFNTYKKYYAMQLQAVALPNLMFTHVYAGWPGSRTDAHVLKRSSLYLHPERYFPDGSFLLGDGGYPALPWLLTPYETAQVSPTHLPNP